MNDLPQKMRRKPRKHFVGLMSRKISLLWYDFENFLSHSILLPIVSRRQEMFSMITRNVIMQTVPLLYSFWWQQNTPSWLTQIAILRLSHENVLDNVKTPNPQRWRITKVPGVKLSRWQNKNFVVLSYFTMHFQFDTNISTKQVKHWHTLLRIWRAGPRRKLSLVQVIWNIINRFFCSLVS